MKATPRPLIKWKSFWLGILVLGFLGWAWFDSYRCRSSCFLKFESSEAQFERAKGYTLVFIRQGKTYLTPLPSGEFQIETSRIRVYFESHWQWLDQFGQPQARVADPVVFFSFLLPWSAFLAWRWQRQRILTKAHDAAPAH